MNSKALWTVLSETINILRNLQFKHKIFQDALPENLTIGLYMYIHVSPFSDHSLLTLILPFKVLLLFCFFKEVWGCFLMSGMTMLHFSKD